MKRVAITGMGLVDPLGYSPEECFNNYLSDIDPIKKIAGYNIEDWPNLKIEIGAEVDVSGCDIEHLKDDVFASRGLVRYVTMGVHTVHQALKSAGLENPSPNGAVIYSTNTGDSDSALSFNHSLLTHKNRIIPKKIFVNLRDFLAGYIAKIYKIRGVSNCYYASCATFVNSLDYALRLVDEYDYVICGSAETGVAPQGIFTFQSLDALSKTGSRPFSKDRDGFVLGDGASCLILESEEKAKSRGAKIYGYVLGIGLASDISSFTAPDPDGFGARMAITKALESANLTTVDFINAHATSTIIGDDIEFNALNDLLPGVPIYSVKSKIGHTLAACGGVEIIHGIKAMEKGIVPKNFNLSNPLSDSPTLITENLVKDSKTFIKTTYAFNGHCGAVIIGKADDIN